MVGLRGVGKTVPLDRMRVVLPKRTMGKAISYFLDEYDALVGYLRDGDREAERRLSHVDFVRP